MVGQNSVVYDVVESPLGPVPFLTTVGKTIDEVIVWRTGDGNIAHTLTAATRPAVQGHAAVLSSVKNGLIPRPLSNVSRSRVWYTLNGITHSSEFDIRWGSLGIVTVTRTTADSGAIN
jgi:hypothetical protein